jgi:fucose permease
MKNKQSTFPAWSFWGITCLFGLLNFFLQLSSGDIVAGVMSSFSLKAFGVSWLLAIYYYIYAALQIPAGFVIDRFGARLVLTIGALVCAFGCFLFATTHYVTLALIGRF